MRYFDLSHRMRLLGVVCALFVGVSVHSTAPYAQGNFTSHRDNMLELASTLGSMHYLRGECKRGEQQVWRDHMLRMLDIEQPSTNFRSQLITTFNEAYNAEQTRFRKCDKKASSEAARLALRGQQLTQSMMANLN